MNNTLKIAFAIVIAAGLVFIAFGSGITHCTFYDHKNTSRNNFTAWCSIPWVQATQADFNAGVPVNVDTNTSPGNVTLNQTPSRSPMIFATLGDTTNRFYQYNVSNNTWTAKTVTPANIGAGGALAYTGGDYIYALRGGGQTNFYRYSISNNNWTSMTSTPAAVNTGGALAYTGGDYIYALRGGGQTNFYRYSISGNSWTSMTSTPNNVQAGGALTYTGGNYIYAFRGSNTNNFYRYSISGNSWTSMTNTPASVRAGGALTYVGGSYSDYIFGFRGDSTAFFWRYSISGNSWNDTAVSDPGAVNFGGALTNNGSTSIYAFRGNGAAFLRYTISTNAWDDAAVANPPFAVGWGGSLVYTPYVPAAYVSPGTLASQVLDTTTNASRWDVLTWNATLPGSTAITFEVRASNTSFAKDAASPSWTAVGGTPPVSSGLPAGRYLQWRARLTSNDTTVTPVLQDVTVYYTDP